MEFIVRKRFPSGEGELNRAADPTLFFLEVLSPGHIDWSSVLSRERNGPGRRDNTAFVMDGLLRPPLRELPRGCGSITGLL